MTASPAVPEFSSVLRIAAAARPKIHTTQYCGLKCVPRMSLKKMVRRIRTRGDGTANTSQLLLRFFLCNGNTTTSTYDSKRLCVSVMVFENFTQYLDWLTVDALLVIAKVTGVISAVQCVAIAAPPIFHATQMGICEIVSVTKSRVNEYFLHRKYWVKGLTFAGH